MKFKFFFFNFMKDVIIDIEEKYTYKKELNKYSDFISFLDSANNR